MVRYENWNLFLSHAKMGGFGGCYCQAIFFPIQALTKYIKKTKGFFGCNTGLFAVHKDRLEIGIRRFLTRYYLLALIAPIVFQLHSHLAQKSLFYFFSVEFIA